MSLSQLITLASIHKLEATSTICSPSISSNSQSLSPFYLFPLLLPQYRPFISRPLCHSQGCNANISGLPLHGPPAPVPAPVPSLSLVSDLCPFLVPLRSLFKIPPLLQLLKSNQVSRNGLGPSVETVSCLGRHSSWL